MDSTVTNFDPVEAENALAGALLIDGKTFSKINQIVTANSFALSGPRAIYESCERLTAGGASIDPVTVLHDAQEHGDPLDRRYIAQLIETTPTSAHAISYAQIVKDHAQRRELLSIADRIAEADKTVSTEQLIADAASALENLTQDAAQGRLKTPVEIARVFYESLENRSAGHLNIVSTGFKKLDSFLGGGLIRSGLHIIAARPGIGKTSFALNVLDNVNGNGLLASLEMSESQITAKRVSRLTGISSQRLTMTKLTDAEYEKVAPATAEVAKSGLHISTNVRTVSDIFVLAQSIPNLRIVCIDYLGLLTVSKQASRYETITELSRSLKLLAMRLDVPVIALSQLNRASESRTDKRPALSDLRDSGAIEQDADTVLLLHRPELPDIELKPWDPLPLEATIAKNRHGETGRVLFNFYAAISKTVEA